MFTRSAHWFLVLFTALALSPAFGADFGYVPTPEQVDVEIAPGRFVSLTRWDWTVDDEPNKTGREQTRLSIPYRGRKVVWETACIPCVLRERDDRLYVAAYDRDEAFAKKDFDRHPIRYYRQKDDGFEEIDRTLFPKAIATQNMFVQDEDLEFVLKLDTESFLFRRSLNAAIWFHLATGEQARDEVEKKLLDEFAEKHRPEKLTKIRKK